MRVSYVSGNAQESIAELEAQFGNHVTENGRGLASRFLYAFYAYQLPLVRLHGNLPSLSIPKGLNLSGESSMQMQLQALAFGLSDVWMVWRRSLGGETMD